MAGVSRKEKVIPNNKPQRSEKIQKRFQSKALEKKKGHQNTDQKKKKKKETTTEEPEPTCRPNYPSLHSHYPVRSAYYPSGLNRDTHSPGTQLLLLRCKARERGVMVGHNPGYETKLKQ